MDKILVAEAFKLLSGKKVFITGHNGFKGTWLTVLLKLIGADVMGYSLPITQNPNHFRLLQLENEIEEVDGDIRDISALRNAVNSFEPEFVIHLAAQALVQASYEDPLTNFQTNVLGSINLLEVVRNTESVRSLVFITSDKCYENVEWVWGYRENDRLGGRDPYSASKAAAEIIFSSYVRSFFDSDNEFAAASTRAGNVIGGGDWAADRLIPDCIRAIENDEAIRIRSPRATRPWQHVLEPLSGYLMLLAALRRSPDMFSGSWNFGPPSTEVRNVAQVASSLVENLGRGRVLYEASEDRSHEANLLQLNCDKSHQLLGWRSRWTYEKTIEMTSEWYKHYLAGYPVKEVTESQIYDYFPELS